MNRKEKCKEKNMQSLSITTATPSKLINRIKIDTRMGIMSMLEEICQQETWRINVRSMYRRMSRHTLLEGTRGQEILRISFHYGSPDTSRMPIDVVKVTKVVEKVAPM